MTWPSFLKILNCLLNDLSWIDKSTAIFLSNNIQAHHIFDYMLEELTGDLKIIVSSFAITEPWVRRLIRSRDRVTHITLFLDFTVASRKPRNTEYTAQNVDELWLTNNHSKTIFMDNGSDRILSMMSNNATNNRRFESGVLFKNHPSIEIYLHYIELMKLGCQQWMK